MPDQLDPSAFGILLALHGLGDNYPDNFQRATAFDKLSDETNDFVVVYPLGSTCIGSEGNDNVMIEVFSNLRPLALKGKFANEFRMKL